MRKQKYPRINLAFYDDNLAYVQEAAYQNRMSVTAYVNHLIEQDQKQASAAQRRLQRRAHWEMVDEYCGHAKQFRCTACGSSVYLDHYTRSCEYNVCPNCDAEINIVDQS